MEEIERLGKLAAEQFLFKRTATGYKKEWQRLWRRSLSLKKAGKTRGYLSENPAEIWEHVKELIPRKFEGDVILVGPWVWKEYAQKLRKFARDTGKRLVLVDVLEKPLVYALLGRDAKKPVRTLRRIKRGTRFIGIVQRLKLKTDQVVPVRREYATQMPLVGGIVIAHEPTLIVGQELVSLIKMIAQGPLILTFRRLPSFERAIAWIKQVAGALGAEIHEREVRHPRGTVYWVARIDPPKDPVGQALLETLAMLATTTRIWPLISGTDVLRANEEAKRALKLAVRSALRRLPKEKHDEFMERLRRVLCAGLEKSFQDICGG